MIDIVERLREWGHPDWFYVTTDLLEDNQDVRLEAADTIARLRSELDQARASLKECVGILETLVDPTKQHISSQHVYAQSIEASARARSILAVASTERQDG